MTIQTVHTFLTDFCAAERQAHEAWYLEPDFDQFREKLKVLNQHARGVLPGRHINRIPSFTLPKADEAQDLLASEYHLRLILKIEAYQHEAGDVYAGYLTDTFVIPILGSPALRTHVRFLIQTVDKDLKIVSKQYPPNVAFPYWETMEGKKIELPEKPSEVVVYIKEE